MHTETISRTTLRRKTSVGGPGRVCKIASLLGLRGRPLLAEISHRATVDPAASAPCSMPPATGLIT
jgi:hypothetical protein